MMSTDEPKYTKGGDLSLWKKASPEERQALELKHKWERELLDNPIVTGVGVGGPRLIIHIDPKASPEEKAKIPRKLDGCEVDVIERGKHTPANTANERHRPLVGGIRVQSVSSFGGLGMVCGTAEGDLEGGLTKFAVVPLHEMITVEPLSSS